MADDSIIPASPSREDYTKGAEYTVPATLNEAEIFDRTEPFSLFADWMSDARQHEINDSNAMSLATVDQDGLPDVRIVLLKGFDPRGFVFYSNSRSVKGQQIASSGRAAMSFHWKSLRRQVRVRGALTRVSDAEADAYFKSRARGSQIGAWASDQSKQAQNRAELEARVRAVEAEYKDRDVPPSRRIGMAGDLTRFKLSFGEIGHFVYMTDLYLSVQIRIRRGAQSGFTRN